MNGSLYLLRHQSVAPRRQVVGRRPSRSAALVCLAVLVVGYVGLTNDVATQGYRLQTLQGEVEELDQANASLELELAGARSLQRVEAALPSLALTPVGRAEYLAAPATTVAVR